MHIFHKAYGKGFPIVLLHGFCETHEIWNDMAEILSKDFQVLCPDLPGFGKSTLPKYNALTIEQVADEIYSWLQTIRIKRCSIIGHSLGGYITLAIAEKYPEVINGFGLFHSTSYPDRKEKKENRNKTMAFVEKNGVNPFVETFVPNLFAPHFPKENKKVIDTISEMANNTSKDTFMTYTKAMRDRPDMSSFLQSYKDKVLFIAGELDNAVPYTDSLSQSTFSDQIIFHNLPHVGHMGMIEAQGTTSDYIKSYVKMLL